MQESSDRNNKYNVNKKNKQPAFVMKPVDVDLKLDLDMAIALGDFILENHPGNPAILALGHQLQNIMPPETSSYSKDEQE